MNILEITLTEITSVGLRSGMLGQAHDKMNRCGVEGAYYAPADACKRV